MNVLFLDKDIKYELISFLDPYEKIIMSLILDIKIDDE